MSTVLTPLPARILCDLANPFPGNVADINDGGSALVLARGDDWQFDIGLALNAALLTGLIQTGAGGVASATLQIFAKENDTNAPLISLNNAVLNTALTQTLWNTGGSANAHFSFVIPNANTGLSLTGQTSNAFWLRIFITTSDGPPSKQLTFLGAPFTVRDGPVSNVSPAAPAFFRMFTIAGVPTPQLYDPVTAHYYNLEIDTVAGIRAPSLGDTAY